MFANIILVLNSRVRAFEPGILYGALHPRLLVIRTCLHFALLVLNSDPLVLPGLRTDGAPKRTLALNWPSTSLARWLHQGKFIPQLYNYSINSLALPIATSFQFLFSYLYLLPLASNVIYPSTSNPFSIL